MRKECCRLIVLALALAPAGAAHGADDQRIVATHGGRAELHALRGGPARVELVGVISDERCPAAVACVWAKAPAIEIYFEAARKHGKFRLTMGAPAPQQLFGDWRVEFLWLEPRPQKPEEFAKLKPLGAYRAGLRITRN